MLARGLDPMDFRSDSIEYPPPSYGPTIRHVRLVVGDVQSVLWSEPDMLWLERLTQQLEAGLFDVGGAARTSEVWGTLKLPFEVRLNKIGSESCGQ